MLDTNVSVFITCHKNHINNNTANTLKTKKLWLKSKQKTFISTYGENDGENIVCSFMYTASSGQTADFAVAP